MVPSVLLRSCLVYAVVFTWIPSARLECSSSTVLQAACGGLNIQNYLESDGSDESTIIRCPNNGHSLTGWSQSPNGDGENLPLLDTSLTRKYTVIENTLTISNINGTDEGLYRCVYGESQTRHTCIYVYGRAIFASCPPAGLDSCATIPTSLSVKEGGNVGFDATVVHTPGGSCGFQQKIRDVRLTKINREFGVDDEPLLFCEINRDSPCGNDRVSLSRGNDPGYEFMFTLSGASSSDSGMYKVMVGLKHPRTGSGNSITKMFHLNITAVPTTTTTTATIDASTTSIPNSSTGSLISVSSGPNDLTIPIAAAAAVPVIIVVVVLAAVVGIGITVRIKGKRNKKISQETKDTEKGPCIQTVEYSGQPIYEAIKAKDVTVLQNHMNGATRGVQNLPSMPVEQSTEVELPPPNNRASWIESDSAAFNHWDNIDNQVVSNV